MTDLSALPIPNIVEPLNYESILSRMKQDLLLRDPEFTNLLESDPAMKVMEVAAWRELLIRQRVNDAARANLLAFASKADLEHLASFYGVERLLEENDESLRRRVQEKIMGWSTAGSRAHYRFHALSADVRVRDARADSPEPGRVRISVLSREDNGMPSEELLQKVRDKVTAENVRVLTDTVEVLACEIIPVAISADIYLYPDTQSSLIKTILDEFPKVFEENRGLGWDLTCSWIIAHLFLTGVQRVELLEPTGNIIADENTCVALESLNLNLAGRDR